MDNKRFSIEVAQPEDLGELISFFDQHGRGLPKFPYRPDAQGNFSAELLNQMFRNSHATILVALEQATGTIVGHVSVHLVASMAGRRAELEMLLIHPAHRGRGLARALMLEALEAARSFYHCDLVVGYNEPERVEARQLLLDLGFQLEPFSDRRLFKQLR